MGYKVLYDRYSRDKKYRAGVIQRENGLYDVYLQELYEEWQDYYDVTCDRHLTDSFESAKEMAKYLLSSQICDFSPMIYGVRLHQGEEYDTDLEKLFHGISNEQLNYNWLIADCVCYPKNKATQDMLQSEFVWLSGEELTKLVQDEPFQWIWAVLCGFEKEVSLSDVLEYPIPTAQDYEGYTQNPLSLQNPLASVEIIACDSSYALLLSTERELIDRFRKSFPMSKDLAEYNDMA